MAMLRSTSLKVYGAIGLIFFAAMASAQEYTRKTGEPSTAPSLNHGKKWETDAVLRTGMEKIRQLMTTSRESIEKGAFGAHDYQRLAEVVNRDVVNILKDCKLTKDTNAALHAVVLADLTHSTELMRTSPKVQVQRAGALGVLQSLRNYGEYFEHPGWLQI